jgi:AbrB family transcriptional regulator, transcriptional pleiotropic regulator of transition state genes
LISNGGGLPRRIDHLGRIVVPVELRRMLGIKAGDELEISVRDGAITLVKAGRSCVFCGSDTDLRSYRERPLCAECAAGVGRLSGGDGRLEHTG